METNNTFESILEGFEKLSLSREPIDPQTWLSGALKLNVLLESEVERSIGLDFILANMRKSYLESGNTASYAKLMVEASEEYMQSQKLKAKIKNADSLILLCKKYATISSDLMRNSL